MARFTYKNTRAFTLAETLISLVIIGVVAALVIPSVLKNYNDKKYNTARLKALKTFGEAGKLASINGEINGQPTARAFVENVLSKYLKIVKVCDNDKAQECNFPEQIQPANPSANKLNSNTLKTWGDINLRNKTTDLVDSSDNKLSLYITVTDGFSAKLFYNPKCITDETSSVIDMACINIIYDMNGVKAPNHVGDDIGFVTTFLSGTKSISVAPGIGDYRSSGGNFTYSEAIQYCNNQKTKNVNLSLPSIEELQSIYLNSWLSSANLNGNDWTTRYFPSNNMEGMWMWTIYNASGGICRFGRREWLKSGAYCVRR